MSLSYTTTSSSTILVLASPSPLSAPLLPPLPLSPASVVPPPVVLLPRKRCKRSSLPHPDTPAEAIIPEVIILKATTTTALVRRRRMVEAYRWAFAMDSIDRIADLEIEVEDLDDRLE
ncbi:hypothetical protein Tco_0613090 [Tanacetum coccineum]